MSIRAGAEPAGLAAPDPDGGIDPDEDDRDLATGDDDELVGLPKDRPGAATRAFAVLLVLGGGLGWIASFALSWDKVKQLQDPNATFFCSVNKFVSCGTVMARPEASQFGFPNSFMGVAGFAIVVTVGMALLAGASFRRWFWLGLQAGVVLGLGLVCWLIGEAVFDIGVLCPYCMVVWSVMIPIFFVVTFYNLRSGHLGRPAVAAGRFLTRHLGEILVAGYVVVLALIVFHFGVDPRTYGF